MVVRLLVFSEKARPKKRANTSQGRQVACRYCSSQSLPQFTLIKHPSSVLPAYPAPPLHVAPSSQLGGFFLTSFSGQMSAEDKASLTRQLDFFFPTSFTSSKQQSCQMLMVFLFECKREWRKPLIPQHTEKLHSRPPSICFLT